MKSANSISATGRRPLRAIPIAIPTIPVSFSGVSITRSGPNFSHSPSVARKTPPFFPTSSPRTTTRGSRSISPAMASRTAWTSVIVAMASSLTAGQPCPLLGEVPGHFGVHILDKRLLRDGRGRLACPHRPGDLVPRLPGHPLGGRVVDKAQALQVPGEAAQRVLLLPRVDLLPRPIARRVVGRRVRAHP